MRRLLILGIAIALAMSALAGPAYACVDTMSAMSAQPHSCCDEPAITTAPMGPCCIVTAPVQRLSSTESGHLPPDLRAVVIPFAMHGGPAFGALARDASPLPLRHLSVPLYLQQVSLLL